MKRDLVISRDALETRVAVLEDGRLAEYHLERPQDSTLTGNIYKARVVRVLPGMQSAFVDYGGEKSGFLFIDDAHPNSSRTHSPNIGDLVRPGSELTVQIEKEPGAHKGAKVTTNISLPGRYVVIFPGKSMVGVSHRVDGGGDRDKLKNLLQELVPDGFGIVARTAAGDATREEIQQDIAALVEQWRAIQKQAAKAPVPSLLHGELDLPLRIVRDFLPEGLNGITCDNEPLFAAIQEYVSQANATPVPPVELHRAVPPVADRFGIDDEIRSALSRRVWLKSGGYLVIDHGEAMTAIDVNTGKNTGKNDFEETLTRTNLEAAGEIARQLRLRNVGGIVVIDFIDMKEAANRDRVRAALAAAVAKDRARCTITGISELGLVQMTRKRVRDSLSARMEDLCPCCEGSGRILSGVTIARDVIRQLQRELAAGNGPHLLVHAHTSVVDRLTGPDLAGIEELEQRHGVRVTFKPVEAFHPERFEVLKGREEDRGKRRR